MAVSTTTKNPERDRYVQNEGVGSPHDAGRSRADAEDARAKGCVVYIPARGADTAPAVPTCAGDFPHGSNRVSRRRIGGAGERNEIDSNEKCRAIGHTRIKIATVTATTQAVRARGSAGGDCTISRDTSE